MATRLSDAYSECTREGSRCYFSGRRSLAYTTPTTRTNIFYRNATNGLDCNNRSFGDNDPEPGVTKTCFATPIPRDILNPGPNFFDSDGNPAGWRRCAVEGGNCTPGVANPIDILYGANRNFNYISAFSVPCNNRFLGDPAPGASKACFWRRPGETTPPVTPAVQPVQPAVQPSAPTNIQPDVPNQSIIPSSNLTPFSPEYSSRVTNPSSNRNLIIGIVLGVILLIIIILIIIIVVRKNRSK